MHCIIYVSKYQKSTKSLSEDLIDICEVAQEKNPGLGITGVLFYQGGYFIQVLEGDKANINFLMNTIKKDKRHTAVLEVMNQPIPERSFEGWNMDSFNLDKQPENFILSLIEFKKIFQSLIKGLDPSVFIESLKEFLKDPSLQRVCH